MNKRRNLVIALGASTLTAPFATFAQPQAKSWRIGFLWEREQSDFAYVQRIDAFNTGMRELGYGEGRDYVIEHRSAETDLARLPALAAELIALKVNLIVSSGSPSTIAARKATREIPILIGSVGDPVGIGVAETLRHPGGNVTGLTNLTTELHTKRLDLLRQIVPAMRRVGILFNPDNASDVQGLERFEFECRKLQMSALRAPVRNAEEIPAAFIALKRGKVQTVSVSGASTNFAWRQSIIEEAARNGLPAVYGQGFWVESGGLISYSANNSDLYRRVAAYADRIFKGAKPGDLPIEQPTKFDLVVNLKTAKTLGIKIPNSVLVQATQVIG